MHTITITDQIWLEPALLGMTLNYSEGPHGVHFRVGMSHQSVKECHRALKEEACVWSMRDGSLTLIGDHNQLTFIFSGGRRPIKRQFVLSQHDLEQFRRAIDLFTEAGIPLLN